MPHEFALRVYYEDTDLAGIVYYANYLKFIERGRTEYVRSIGIDQTALKAQEGVVFAVRRIEADYILPAKFDDELQVVTTTQKLTAARVILKQEVARSGVVLFAALVTLVALDEEGRPARMPANIRRLLH